MPDLEKKMRIQLFDKKLNQLSDRLVSQDTEIYKGPTVKHEGPLRVEFSLFTQSDIEGCVNYLQKLSGLVPIEIKIKKSKKSKVDHTEIDKEAVLKDIEENVLTSDMETTIKNLREKGYVFVTSQRLLDLGLPFEFKVGHDQRYDFMILQLKRAKDPRNDKFDPTLVFGIRLTGTRNEKVLVYMYGGYHKTLKIPWGNIKTKITPKEMLRFPSYMTEDERLKFSKEYRVLQTNSEIKASKFYERWKPYVKFPE